MIDPIWIQQKIPDSTNPDLQHCLLKQTKNLEENPDGFAGVL
jgi:hypothetical protein